jgi:O-antigen ligase
MMRNKINKNIVVYLFFTLLVVYQMQGYFYTTGSLLSQGCLFFIILLSLFYFLKTFLIKKNSFYYIWTLFFVLNTLYFVFTGIYETLWFNMYKNILILSTIYYPFYFFTVKGWLAKKQLIIFAVIILPIIIFQYFYDMQFQQTLFGENITNNTGYVFVKLMPFVFLFNKRYNVAAWVFVMILSYFVLMSAKRGAIVVGGITVICFIYYQVRINQFSLKTFLLILVALFLLISLMNNVIENNEYLQARYKQTIEGYSSQRDIIYFAIISKWLNADVINYFWGFGFAASLIITKGAYAHNDWLEILSNAGLLGVGIYLTLFLTLIISIKKNNWDKDKCILMITILLTWFFTTLFSMWYTAFEAYLNVILIAYLLGNKNKHLV